VGSSAAVFDPTKLEWLSQQWLKRTPPERLAEVLRPFVERAGLTPRPERAWLARVADTLRERAKALAEMVELGRFYFERPATLDAPAARKLLTPEGVERLALLTKRLAADTQFDAEHLELVFRGLAAELSLKLVDLAQLARLAVTGRTASPPIFVVLELLGKAETLARLRAAPTAAPRE
jgi:glutamyl-tRNA synthetase